MEKRKFHVVTFVAVILIIIISIAIGFSYDSICEKIEKKRYPMHYSEYVEMYSELYEIPPEIVYSIIKTESSFNETAVSSAGAIGLMQIMPETFEWLKTKTGDAYSDEKLYTPDINIRYGCYLLSILYDQLGVWENVYAAYNAGIGRVRKWLKDSAYSENGILKSIPIEETHNYIIRVKKNIMMYRKLYFTV